MGVKELWFIHSRKVEKSYWQASVLQEEAVDKEIRLALEQCGDTVWPNIYYRNRFKPFAEDELPGLIAQADAAIFGHPRSIETPEKFNGQKIVLLVGPEGGFSEKEFDNAEKIGYNMITLGKRILRCETAPIAAISILMNMTDNM